VNSFTDQVKHELLQKKDFLMAELAAIIRMKGSIFIKNKQLSLQLKISHGDLVRKIYSCLKNNFSFDLEIMVSRNNSFNKNYNYKLLILPQQGLEEFLLDLGFLDEKNNIIFRIKEDFKESLLARKSYLRGVFLGGGSVNDPHGEYHLEIRCDHESHAQDLIQLLKIFELSAHINKHKSKYVVYLKRFNDITAYLNLVGAYKAQLKMEKAHLLKDVKSNVNRKVNAETANLDKTVRAAMEQLADIKVIEEKNGLDQLSKGLVEIAELRKKHPYASLKELGELLDPPLSKSGVNHRLRRLRKIASKFK